MFPLDTVQWSFIYLNLSKKLHKTTLRNKMKMFSELYPEQKHTRKSYIDQRNENEGIWLLSDQRSVGFE